MNTHRAAGLLIAAVGLLAGGCSTVSEGPPAVVTVSDSTHPPAHTAPAPHGGQSVHPPAPPPGPGPQPGPVGADGSTGNDLSPDYCARNEDPGCPVGSYIGPDAIPDPNGDDSYVPCEGTVCTNPDHGAGPDDGDPAAECEGTVCTNPNHGAGPDPDGADTGGDIPEPGQDMQAP